MCPITKCSIRSSRVSPARLAVIRSTGTDAMQPQLLARHTQTRVKNLKSVKFVLCIFSLREDKKMIAELICAWIVCGVLGVIILHAMFVHPPIRFCWYVLAAMLGPIIFVSVFVVFSIMYKIDGK